ncbi:MAG: hypothetical protein R3B98_07425 [Hyphomonas sp.]
MKKLIIAGVCVLSLTGCDAIKGTGAPKEDVPEAAPAVNPVVAAREAFQAHDVLLPSADLGDRVYVTQGTSAKLTDYGTVIVATTPEAPDNSTGRPGGYSIALTPEQEAAYSYSKVRVQVLARAPEGKATMRVDYSTADVGNSGWRDFEVGKDYAVSTFDYNVNLMQEGNNDYVAFLAPDGPVEIAAIGFDSTPFPPPADQPAEEPASPAE